MKYVRYIFSLLVCCFLILPLSLEAEKKVVISIFGAVSSPINKISEQVVREGYKQIGVTMETRRLPGERALMRANSGETDGDICRVKGIENRFTNLMMIPVKVVSVEFVVFTKDKHFKVNGWESLRPYSIGYLRGLKIITQKTQGLGMKLSPVNTEKQAFFKLDLGRTDVVVDPLHMGLAVLSEFKIKSITVLKPPLEEFVLFHYINKKNKTLAPKLEAALTKMTKDGQIERIKNAVYEELYSQLSK